MKDLVSVILYIAWLYNDVNAKVKVGNKIKSLLHLHLYTSETNLQNL
jgi:ribonuclease HIII